MINADSLNLIGLGIHGLAGQPTRIYRIKGSNRTWLRADRSPGNWDFKMIPIIDSQRGPAEWFPRHMIENI